MYLSLIRKPTDEDLERCPAVHLTGPHEWYPSVLDFTPSSGDGKPPWSNDPENRFAFDPNSDEFREYTQRAIQTLTILDDSSLPITPCLLTNMFSGPTSMLSIMPLLTMKNSGFSFCWGNVDTVQKTMEQSTQWGVSIPNTFPMKSTLSLGI